MKKKCVIIFVLVLIIGLASAMAEEGISFQGIPWLSDGKVAMDVLWEKGFVSEEKAITFSQDNVQYIAADETTLYRPTFEPIYEQVCFSISLSGNVKGKIAGYPIKDIILTFAYDGEYKL